MYLHDVHDLVQRGHTHVAPAEVVETNARSHKALWVVAEATAGQVALATEGMLANLLFKCMKACCQPARQACSCMLADCGLCVDEGTFAVYIRARHQLNHSHITMNSYSVATSHKSSQASLDASGEQLMDVQHTCRFSIMPMLAALNCCTRS